MTPAWILDLFAAVMLIVSAISAGRLALEWPWRHDTRRPDVDVAHVLMGISMAGMLAGGLRTLPPAAWEVIFGVLTVWFSWQVARDARAEGVRALAGGHCAPHMIHSAAMLYMYLALVTPASGMQSLSYPTIAFAFGLLLAGYSVWDLDRVSGRGLVLSPGTAVSCRIAMGVTMALMLFIMI